MVKKILAAVLAMLMVLCAIPLTAFADDDAATPEQIVSTWNMNYGLVLQKLADNENSAHWQYVDQNKKKISDTMATLTAFALYDDAWANGLDRSISKDKAKQILASLIEKIDTGIGESKLAEITAVLQTASDLEDLLQKVNSYVKISDVLTSEDWVKAFKYIRKYIEMYHMYDKARDEVIEAYALILSVQAANELYIDFLQHIVDTTEYATLAQAAQELIDALNQNIADAIKDKLIDLAVSTGTGIIEDAIEVAMESNYYTGIILGVYNAGTKVADVLWNTSDLYECMDALYTTYYVETAAASWYNFAQFSAKADWIEFSIRALLTLREVGLDTLYDLKKCENQGLVGKVKDQINCNIGFEYIAEKSFLTLTREVLLNKSIDEAKKVNSIVSISSDAFVNVDGDEIENSVGIITLPNAIASVDYNVYTDMFVKTIFVTGTADIALDYSSDVKATVIVERDVKGTLDDFSFTTLGIVKGDKVVFNTGDIAYTYISADGEAETTDFNDEFVYPELNEINVKTVTNAVVGVVKQESKGTIQSIKDFFNNLFAKIREIIARIKAL